jgi:hypothetical protein
MEAIPARTWTVAGSARHVTRRLIARYPAVYLPVSRRRQPQSTLAQDTQLVIDGFTRSASTFAVVAFQLAQNAHVRVAHHLHAPAHLLAATRAGVPTLMPIRPPRDTVLSAAIREPTVPMSQWLRSFAEFYRRVEPVLDEIVVASFQSVTTDMGGLIDRVNERFATSFVRFDDSADNVEAVFDIIEERARRPAWQHLLGEFLSGGLSWDEYRVATAEVRVSSPPPEVPEHRVQRPSAEREQAKAALSAQYDGKALAGARRAAEQAYASAAAVAH